MYAMALNKNTLFNALTFSFLTDVLFLLFDLSNRRTALRAGYANDVFYI